MVTDEAALWKSRFRLLIGLFRSSKSDTAHLIDRATFLTKLESYGFPSTFEELEALCHVPPDQNAAGDYLLAFEAMAQVGQDLLKAIAQKQVRSDLMGSVVEHIDRALSHPSCAFDKDWRKGIDVDFSQLMKMKRLSEVCLARACGREHGGDVSRARSGARSCGSRARASPNFMCLLDRHRDENP